jgi:uncharacterized protein with beta-barrel porin domain
MTSGYLEGGYDMKSNAWTTTPFVSAGDEHLDRGAIAEQGAGGFGITASSDDFNQSYAQLVRASPTTGHGVSDKCR